MHHIGRWAGAMLVAGAMLGGLGALSRIKSGAEPAVSTLKLSWRVRGHHVERCHTMTPAELEKLPIHMRRQQVCEGRMAPYTLTLHVDGVLLDSSIIVAAGARQDRPVYVYREVRIPSGAHRLVVTFALDSLDRRAAEMGEGHGGGSEPMGDIDAPVALLLDRRIELGRGEVALVTYDAEHSVLVLRDSPASGR